jgi:F-type H+-transporting ATPase subunit c
MIRFRLFVISALMTLLVVGTAMAQTGGAAPANNGTNLKLLAPFAVGIAAFGGALGDGRAIAGACEGTARNPGAGGRIFTMLLLGLALIETLVLFTFLTLFLV